MASSDQGELFHLDMPERAEKPKGRRWGGNDSRQARAIVRAMGFPAPCTRCGRPVTEDMDWHADHIQEDTFGGASDASNLGPAHAKCNTSAGGKIGARMTNGYKQENASHRERTIKWW